MYIGAYSLRLSIVSLGKEGISAEVSRERARPLLREVNPTPVCMQVGPGNLWPQTGGTKVVDDFEI